MKKNRLNNVLELLNKIKILEYLPDDDIILLPVVNSTNQYLIDHILKLKSGCVCITEYQKNGRGKCGSTWISSFGKSLCLSLYWKIKSELVMDINLSVMIGIVIVEILHDLGISKVRMKWPNDLYLNGRKLGGILVERVFKIKNFYHHLIIGVGINLIEDTLISCYLEKNKWINLLESNVFFDRNILAAMLICGLRRFFRTFEEHGFFRFESRWRSIDHFYGSHVRLLCGQRILQGNNCGIDKHGYILLENQGKVHSYVSKDISFM